MYPSRSISDLGTNQRLILNFKTNLYPDTPACIFFLFLKTKSPPSHWAPVLALSPGPLPDRGFNEHPHPVLLRLSLAWTHQILCEERSTLSPYSRPCPSIARLETFLLLPPQRPLNTAKQGCISEISQIGV